MWLGQAREVQAAAGDRLRVGLQRPYPAGSRLWRDDAVNLKALLDLPRGEVVGDGQRPPDGLPLGPVPVKAPGQHKDHQAASWPQHVGQLADGYARRSLRI